MKFNKLSLDIFKRTIFTRKKREKDYLKKGFEEQKKVFNIVESSKDIIYCYESNPSSKFRYLSPSINTFLGQGVLEEAYNDPSLPFERIHPDDFEILNEKVYVGIDYTKPVIQRWRDNEGNYLWFEEYATPIYEEEQLVAVQGIIRNIDERVRFIQDMEYQMSHDPLTNIHNRQFFDNISAKSNLDFDTQVAMILCDLDELKFMNDTYGHKRGDELIKEAANLLKGIFSDIAVVSRVGGDEFAILLIDRSKREVESLCKLLNEEILLHNSVNKGLHISMSFGHAYRSHSKGNMDSLFMEADQKMFQDKRRRKEQKLVRSVR
ncbi:putative diguanylate cyclase YfiN [Peribacillus sp. Bi96]|uniref:sensor domain-containing diguanylate cyclase n=1 Tax=unclassified Peribacillus TaxID=2675266 RepID=UPI001D521BF5|nr:sensor domain-containing diguanylate cyclase [Peribacillus sp. Bi96]CAH0248532.1 putative diguanylate cyclase YfiN [Peribacillus sp. Bi96]